MEFTFVYFRSLVRSLRLRLAFSVNGIKRERSWKKAREPGVRGLEQRRWKQRGKKRRVEAWPEERQRGTVRSDARQRRGEPATSQPDCKTLYKTRRARVTQDDWFVRSFIRSLKRARAFVIRFRVRARPQNTYARNLIQNGSLQRREQQARALKLVVTSRFHVSV